MRQFKTTEYFFYKGQSLPAIPLLVDKECRPVPVANHYMMYIVLQKGKIHSPITWKNISDALYDYFSFLEANNLSWDDEPLYTDNGKEASNLALYQKWCHDTYLKNNGIPLVHSTINARTSIIESFYRWARDTAKLISWLPFITEFKPVRYGHPDFLAHTHGEKLVESSELRLPVTKTIPKVMSLEECRELLSAPMSRTVWNATCLMLGTGIRNMECRTFPRKYVIDPSKLNKNIRIRIFLDPHEMSNKNNKPRIVYLTWQMMNNLHQYTKFGEGVIRAKLFEKEHGHLPTLLFLNDKGEPFSAKGLNNRYRDFWKGKEKRGKKYPPVISFHINPHKLRHTFATMELFFESEREDINGRKRGLGYALAWVKNRLGHSSLQTTSIYVHCLDQMDNHELNVYQQELDKMMRGEKDAK